MKLALTQTGHASVVSGGTVIVDSKAHANNQVSRTVRWHGHQAEVRDAGITAWWYIHSFERLKMSP